MICEPHTGNHRNFVQSFYPLRCNSNVLKLKTSWYLQRKINFKLLIKNQLGPARRAKISKMFGYLFFSALGPQPNISTLSTLLVLLLQKFEFALRVRYCCIISAYSSDFIPSPYLQLWIICVDQKCTADTSLGEELIGLLSLGAADIILSGIITFKICGMPSNGWAMVTIIVHPLKLLQLFRFDDVDHPWLELLRFIKSTWPVVITLPAPDKKCPMDSFPRGVLLSNFIIAAHQ